MKTITNETEVVKRDILKDAKYVYHGTHLSKLKWIKRDGLTTNTENGNNNFDTLSRPNSIYFTTSKQHAFNFVRWKYDETPIILKIPVEALAKAKLIRDENFKYDTYSDGYGSTCFRAVNATIKEFEVEIIKDRDAFIREYFGY